MGNFVKSGASISPSLIVILAGKNVILDLIEDLEAISKPVAYVILDLIEDLDSRFRENDSRVLK